LQQHKEMADDSISISWESVYKISCGWIDVPIFYVILFGIKFLPGCDFVMDSAAASGYQILCRSQKNVTQTLAMNKETVQGRKHERYKGV
jgi:hypothetical protein